MDSNKNDLNDADLGYQRRMNSTKISPPTGMNDGGERTQYKEGSAFREPDDNKPRPELISPFALNRLADWYGKGAKKYASRNWEKGMPFSRYTASMFRHLIAWMMGKTDEDHLAAVAWNAFAIMHHQELGEDEMWDDMPKYNIPDETSK